MKFVILAIFATFVTQSFHLARKIPVTFAIFAKFAISSIFFLIAVFFKSFLLKLRIQFAIKFLLTRSILDISARSGAKVAPVSCKHPPNFTSHVHQTILNNATIIACNNNYNQLCFLESLLIKRYIPQLNYGIIAAKSLYCFSFKFNLNFSIFVILSSTFLSQLLVC